MDDTTMTPDATLGTDTSSLMRCYGLMSIGCLLASVPVSGVSAFGFLVLLPSAIWAYRLRRRPDPLFYNHGRWMLRSFWLFSLLTLLASILSGGIVSANADNTAIDGLAEAISTGSATPDEIIAMLKTYKDVNGGLINAANIVCALPVAAFALVRLVKGYRYAEAGKPIDPVTSWTI